MSAANTQSDYVILVDAFDLPIGREDKMKAHEQGLLHRAFSVFIFREHQSKTEWLLQQRHEDKYHCGGLWTNTCCSHPCEQEDIISAGKRRLVEELGFTTSLRKAGHFIYKADFDNGLSEYEYDHVLVGQYQGEKIVPNASEVKDYKWVEIAWLINDMAISPKAYTPWLKQVIERCQEVKCTTI